MLYLFWVVTGGSYIDSPLGFFAAAEALSCAQGFGGGPPTEESWWSDLVDGKMMGKWWWMENMDEWWWEPYDRNHIFHHHRFTRMSNDWNMMMMDGFDGFDGFRLQWDAVLRCFHRTSLRRSPAQRPVGANRPDQLQGWWDIIRNESHEPWEAPWKHPGWWVFSGLDYWCQLVMIIISWCSRPLWIPLKTPTSISWEMKTWYLKKGSQMFLFTPWKK